MSGVVPLFDDQAVDKTAISRFVVADDYRIAAGLIEIGRSTDNMVIRTIFPQHLLMSFSLELYLKAWLLACGATDTAMKDYGHRLRKLFEAALTKGLPAIQNLDQMVEGLKDDHERNAYRYAVSGDDLTYVNPRLALKALEELGLIVEERCICFAHEEMKRLGIQS